MKQSRLSAIVTSKKNHIRLEFAILFDPEKEPIETLGTDWIKEGLTEVFWENSELFKEVSFDDFGGFDLSFELNGEKFEYSFEFDIAQELCGLFFQLP